MAIVGKSVVKAASVDAVISLPVGKKLYGVSEKFGMEVFIKQNGIEYRVIGVASTTEYYFPMPLDFAATTEIIFRGTTAGKPLIFMDE